MKALRRWSRILHRDIGFFFIGTTLVYALSGMALNHIGDWSPSYTVSKSSFTTQIPLQKGDNTEDNVKQLAAEIAPKLAMKKYYYPEDDQLKIFLQGGSSILVNTESGEGTFELLQKRLLFYQVNYLHYNPSVWWTWFSDIFAIALIILAVTSFFMVKGKKGMAGTGGIYTQRPDINRLDIDKSSDSLQG